MLIRGRDCYYKRLWVWVKTKRGSGFPKPHWAPGPGCRGKNSIRIHPPTRDLRCWTVVVDGFEIVELRGIDAPELALCVAEAFARQKDVFRTVLRAQRLMSHKQWRKEFKRR